MRSLIKAYYASPGVQESSSFCLLRFHGWQSCFLFLSGCCHLVKEPSMEMSTFSSTVLHVAPLPSIPEESRKKTKFLLSAEDTHLATPTHPAERVVLILFVWIPLWTLDIHTINDTHIPLLLTHLLEKQLLIFDIPHCNKHNSSHTALWVIQQSRIFVIPKYTDTHKMTHAH